jgi:hypothetical protein
LEKTMNKISLVSNFIESPGEKQKSGKESLNCWVPKARACNRSYSGGRGKKDGGNKGKHFERLYLEKTHHKKGW